jgi:Xaa-Pro aminopeptidase
MLQPQYCRSRQKRLLNKVGHNVDAFVIGAPHHVYYLSGYWTDWRQMSAMVLLADGRTILITPNQPCETAAADDCRSFEANWFATLRQEQPAALAIELIDVLAEFGVKRIGFDSSVVASQLVAARLHSGGPIDNDLFQLRRQKDPDELDLMQTAIGATEAMYARARQIIEPGVDEVLVFAELQATAVQFLGEPMTALLGNDFACGVGGGWPRKGRKTEAGELYILDLGPAYRGYYADNCRVIAVDRKPTDEQQKAREHVIACLDIVESFAKPGVRCQALYDACDQALKLKRGKGMGHHLGHGVGLSPHEFPHLNPKWDDALLEGEVFTAEPGVYAEELRGGIRIENQYLVTKDGVRNLTPFSTELA